MSRRRRRAREAGPVRKTVEVVVSALFGMAVVGVVLVLLQSGSSPASQGPTPGTTLPQDPTGQGAGTDGGLGIRSADAGTQSATSSTVYSAVPAPTQTGPGQGASAAEETGTGVPASTAPGTATPQKSDPGSTTQPSASATGTPSASASSGSGALGGVVGGLVGGVLGLL